MQGGKEIVVLSPHPDDAALDCSDHILAWKELGLQVSVVTVFTRLVTSSTEGPARDSLADLQRIRIYEDNKAMSALGVSWNQLGFVDAAFRYDRENLRYSDVGRRRSTSNDQVLNVLIRTILSLRNQSVFVVPLGVGGHLDHILVREAAEGAVDPTDLYYYVDYPYALSVFNWTRSNLAKVMRARRSIRWMSKAKKQLLQMYSSQIPLVFSHSRFSIPWITWTILRSYPEIILYQKRIE